MDSIAPVDFKYVIGTKQTLKAIHKGEAAEVYVALDADQRLVEDLFKSCSDNSVPVKEVATMVDLGQACGIKVKTASAARLK